MFVGDDVNDIIKESIDAVLGNAPYKHAFVGQWTNDVVETCVKRLAALNKPFKYVVTCVIMQRNGAGLHTASSCYWDNDTDGSRTVRWENKSMYCVTTVFGLAIRREIVARLAAFRVVQSRRLVSTRPTHARVRGQGALVASSLGYRVDERRTPRTGYTRDARLRVGSEILLESTTKS